ncbi:MAG: SdpI family protein [Clostridia bacterium]|nr:SdpI family protein [Clostridia bacterium]
MGFWIFMLIMSLLVPLVMIVFGIIFLINAPKGINYIYGYRTRRSMKSKEAWKYSHRLLGILWIIFGIIFLPIALIPMLFVINKGEDIISIVGAIITLVSFIPMCIPIIFVERGLKINFDMFGHKIDKE